MTRIRNGNGAVHPIHVADAFALAIGRFAAEVGSEVGRLNAACERERFAEAIADAQRRHDNLLRLEAALSEPSKQERRA